MGRKSQIQLKPGTRLVRRYKGNDVVVEVREDGQFQFLDKTFSSLTAIAKSVTGYKAISGPAFFKRCLNGVNPEKEG